MSFLTTQSASLESLLEQSDWIHKLARRLAHDASSADDLAQDTWVRLLSNPPKAGRSLRGWIATVMRNHLSHSMRSERRRWEHERVAVLASPASEAEAAIERVERQREIAGLVLVLDEPYRTTLILRYFEGCSPTRIAKRQGVPVSTVKTRLSRGLERVRASLERAHGGRRQWLAAFAPLLQPVLSAAPLWAPSSVGTLVMQTKWVVAALVIFVAGATWIVLGPFGGPVGVVVSADEGSKAGSSTAATAGGLRESTEADRIAAARSPVASPARTAGAPSIAAPLVEGRALSVAGDPLEGVAIRLATALPEVRSIESENSVVLAISDAHGEFQFDPSVGAGRLVSADVRYATVLAARQQPGLDGARVVVVAPRIDLLGQVFDHNGAPVARALVAVEPPADLRARVGAILDDSTECEWQIETGADGRFDLPDVGAIENATLVVRAVGYLPHAESAPQSSRDNLLVTLQPPAAEAQVLEGIVVDSAGVPVDGAIVSMGVDTERTKANGSFAFQLEAETSFNRELARFVDLDLSQLVAIKPGHLPGRVNAPRRGADGRPEWPTRVRIELGGTPAAISGEVVDLRGDPIAGVRVWIADPTFFGALGDPALRRPELTHVETTLSGSTNHHGFVETDLDGRFHLGGLLLREYTIHAMDDATLQRVVRVGVPSGRSNLRLQFSAEGLYESLRGRAVDSSGLALAGVKVFPMCDPFVTRVQGTVLSTRHSTVEGVTTDSEGGFELKRVPRDLTYLRFESGETIPLEWGRGVEGGLSTLVGDRFGDVVVTLPRRCHFDVELDNPAEADNIGILDVHGEALTISEFLGSGRREMRRQSLRDGRSNPLGVSDAGTTLVLYLDGAEVRRLPIQLDPNKAQKIRP